MSDSNIQSNTQSDTSGAAPDARAPVTMLDTPIRVDYAFTAGEAQSRFLRGLANGKFLGQRCPVCRKVYVPPRGSCPTDGVMLAEDVELGTRER